MKRGFGKKEGKSVLESCEFSKLKRFKPIQFSSSSGKWRVITEDEISGSSFAPEVTRTPSESNSYEYDEGISSSRCSSLPDELVTEILVRLPVKSVLRFKNVCKRWYAIFNTPTFIRRNLCLKSPHNAMLLLRRRVPPPRLYHQSGGGDDLVDIFSFHDLNSPERKVRPVLYTSNFLPGISSSSSSSSSDLRLLGSIDGIICIKNDLQSCYILCNPTLCQYKLVPPLLCDLPHEPRYCPQEVDGFGISYSSSSSSSSTSSRLEEELDFKIIVMHRFVHKQDAYARASGGFPNQDRPPLPFVLAHLYTWKTNSWRRLDDAPLIPVMPHPFNSIFFNGACHWCGVNYAMDREMILSFNMTSEVFLLLELPDCLQGDCPHPIVVHDCLGVVQYSAGRICTLGHPFEIWVMKEYGVNESWTKQFVISPQPFGTTFLPWKNDTMLLLQRRPLSILLTLEDEGAARKCRDQLQSIDLHTSKIRKFQVFGDEGSLCGLIHEESLVSLN